MEILYYYVIREKKGKTEKQREGERERGKEGKRKSEKERGRERGKTIRKVLIYSNFLTQLGLSFFSYRCECKARGDGGASSAVSP